MKQPVRVLFVLNAPGGGATQGILELLKKLPRAQYEGYVIVPSEPDARQRALFEQLAVGWQVVPMSWWSQREHLPPWWRILGWSRRTLQTLLHGKPVAQLVKIIRSWDIDIVYSGTSLTLDGALAARVCRRPHLWHIKETIGKAGRVHFPLPHGWLVRFMAGISAKIIVMTRYIGQAFEGSKAQAKVQVIYDGVELDSFAGEIKGNELRETLGVATDEVLIAMSASLSAVWKQHGVFIEMAALLADRFPHVRFAAFGPEPKQTGRRLYDGPWYYYQKLKSRVRTLGLESRFIWAGFHADIPQIMDAIDILVHPCDIEPFGRIAIEAMAAGTVVVGPQAGGIAESVVDEETGLLVAPHDPKAFAEAVAQLIVDKSLRLQMGQAGKKRVKTDFSLERHVREIVALFDEVVKEGEHQAA